jgi:tagatose-1,6-bisphosphate aldolase
MKRAPLSAGKYRGLRRLADARGRFKMLAVDQGPPIEGLVAERRQVTSAPVGKIKRVGAAGACPVALKNVLNYAFRAGASGYLAGRAIWWGTFQAFPDEKLVRQALATGASDDMHMLPRNGLAAAYARPRQSRFADERPADADSFAFRHDYADL